MAYVGTQLHQIPSAPPDRVTIASGSWFEVCCGAIGLALGVLGMLGGDPRLFGAVATVILGFGVFGQAGTIASWTERSSVRGDLVGVGVDLVAAIAGIGLGALVVLHVVPVTWLTIAAMALGLGLVFAARVDLAAGARTVQGFAQVFMSACGFAAMVLALVAVVSVDAAAVSLAALAALACVGAGLVLAGGGSLTALARRKREA
jgi:hypothetical protein